MCLCLGCVQFGYFWGSIAQRSPLCEAGSSVFCLCQTWVGRNTWKSNRNTLFASGVDTLWWPIYLGILLKLVNFFPRLHSEKSWIVLQQEQRSGHCLSSVNCKTHRARHSPSYASWRHRVAADLLHVCTHMSLACHLWEKVQTSGMVRESAVEMLILWGSGNFFLAILCPRKKSPEKKCEHGQVATPE